MTKTHLILVAVGIAAGYMLRDQLLKAPLYPKAYSFGANLGVPKAAA